MSTKAESLRELKKTEKKQRIQQAAIKVMASVGYHGTTVSQIAREAGVADGTLYLYFENKEDLLLKVIDDIMERFIDEGREILKRFHSPLDQLRALVELHLRNLGSDDHLAKIFQIELRHNEKVMRLFSETRLRKYFSIIEGLIRRAQDGGQIRDDINPWMTTKIIFGAMDEMATNWVLRAKDYRLEDMAAPTLDILLNGMCTAHARQQPSAAALKN